jgi:hypothetical protein
MMNGEARNDGVTSSSATVERAIALASSVRHTQPTLSLRSSIQTSTGRLRTTGASISSNRRRHSASWRL